VTNRPNDTLDSKFQLSSSLSTVTGSSADMIQRNAMGMLEKLSGDRYVLGHLGRLIYVRPAAYSPGGGPTATRVMMAVELLVAGMVCWAPAVTTFASRRATLGVGAGPRSPPCRLWITLERVAARGSAPRTEAQFARQRPVIQDPHGWRADSCQCDTQGAAHSPPLPS
jgi:hypothetical protein